jgi:phosphonate dehydrogenase
MIDMFDYKSVTLTMNKSADRMSSPSLRPRILVTNQLHPSVLEMLRADFEVLTNETPEPWTGDTLLAKLEEHQPDGLIAFMSDHINKEVLQASTKLKIVAAALKGTNNIDVESATALGICVTYVPGLLTEPTAELTLALMLMQARQLPQATQFVQSGHFKGWEPRFYAKTLFDADVGLLGFGAIGQQLTHLLTPFRARVKFYDPAITAPPALGAVACDFDEVIQTTDYLVLALPHTPVTHHLVDKKLLYQMRLGAVLVNTARGSIVNESDVADALEANHLSGYVADVFEMEDWAVANRPKVIDPRLLSDSRVVMSPHIGSAIRGIRVRIESDAAETIIAFYAGQPLPTCLNPHIRN